ncbi:MAG TPA: magnesium transporter CorA family protein [Actinomycetota bacterium]|jgi:magnesium transporter|nr:magnesium transporter CorA family protein [Actinomycetota bacterium]
MALCRTADGWSLVDGLDEALRLRHDPDTLVWIESDVTGLPEAEMRKLGQEFQIDPLAIEDALSPRQRPKLEAYPGHLLLVVHQLDEDEDDQLLPRQLAAFIGRGFVVLLHHGADRVVGEARRRVESAGDEVTSSDRLLHAVVDTAVDDDESIATRIAQEVEVMEDEALTVARAGDRRDGRSSRRGRWPSQYRLYTLKQQITTLRRYALPIASALERRPTYEGQERDDTLDRLFRDVHDHVVRLGAEVRSSDDLTDGVLELVRSFQADELNETNRKLTAWAAIIAGPALIVGLYGTNYGLLPPRSVGQWGFALVLLLMATTSGLLFGFFRRRGWL